MEEKSSITSPTIYILAISAEICGGQQRQKNSLMQEHKLPCSVFFKLRSDANINTFLLRVLMDGFFCASINGIQYNIK